MREKRDGPEVLDLFAAAMAGGSGAILIRESDDLDLNLVRFAAGAGVAPHLNREVDVLMVVMVGSGTVTVENEAVTLSAGKAVLIPKGVERAIRSAEEDELVYLTVHRRRRGLMPARRGTPDR